MRVAFGTDESNEVTAAVVAALVEAGHEVIDPVVAAWPDVGHRVGRAVATGAADRGVVCCWTGTGVSIAANKVPGVRAALCTDAETARGARRWNDANVVALGLRLTSVAVAREIVAAFVGSEAVDPDEVAHIDRVESVESVGSGGRPSAAGGDARR
jgi:ribose 5-phosphate isomerase B